jgi:hypothetical protein
MKTKTMLMTAVVLVASMMLGTSTLGTPKLEGPILDKTGTSGVPAADAVPQVSSLELLTMAGSFEAERAGNTLSQFTNQCSH